MKRLWICSALLLAGVFSNIPLPASNSFQSPTSQTSNSQELPEADIMRILEACSVSISIEISSLFEMYAEGHVEIQQLSENTYEIAVQQVAGDPIIAVICDSL